MEFGKATTAEWRHVSAAVDCTGRSHTGGEVCLETGPRSALHQRSLHAHRVANFYLLSVTGPKMPPDLKEDAERTVTSKAEVINWLKRSLDAVKQTHLAIRPQDLARKVQIRAPGCHGGRHVSTHHRSCQRAHGAVDRVCAHDGRRAALVKMKLIKKHRNGPFREIRSSWKCDGIGEWAKLALTFDLPILTV